MSKLISDLGIVCLDIIKKSGKNLYLTSSENIFKYEDNRYLPNSSISLDYFEYDESGISNIKLSGFFEKNGLESFDGFDDALFRVLLLDGNNCQKFLAEFFLKSSLKTDMKFEIELTAVTNQYSKNIVKNYSTSCRAKFKDEFCKIEIDEFQGETCDKSFTMCCNKFKNAINFRGEPFIPTIGYFNEKNK